MLILQGLLDTLQTISVQAQVNYDVAHKDYVSNKAAAGYTNIEDTAEVEERLSQRKEGGRGLNAAETMLSTSMYILEDELDLLESIQALEGAVGEFHHPPSSMSQRDYWECLASLRKIKAILMKPYPMRQRLLVSPSHYFVLEQAHSPFDSQSPFRDGKEWDAVAQHFYEYSMFAIDTVMGHLESAFHDKQHSFPNQKFWTKEAERWEALFETHKNMLEQDDLDRVSLGYRRNAYILLDRAKEDVIHSLSMELCDEALRPIFGEVKRVLADFNEHTRYVVSYSWSLYRPSARLTILFLLFYY